MSDGFVNPLDPIAKSGPEAQLELFQRCVEVCRGRPASHVISAAVNMLVNGIRQSQSTRRTAFDELEQLMGQAKTLLAQHYDTAGGKRLNVFPHTQHVNMPHLTDPDFLRKVRN